MTLILTVQTQGSIWLVADRRLSAPGRPPIDDAIKVAAVDVADGTALMGYAGLGATAFGSQPSQWVSNVLRGRHHTLEQSLNIVANAIKREFIRHMNGVRDTRLRRRSFIIPAFHHGLPRIYTIDMAHTLDGYKFRYTRHILGGPLTPLQVTVPLGMAGSGAIALLPAYNWKRRLLRLVKAYNRRQIRGQTVAEQMAQLAYKSHLETSDGTVGSDCLVIWRNSKRSLYRGGGSHIFFSHGKRVQDASIPMISSGLDSTAFVQILAEVTTPQHLKTLQAMIEGVDPPEPENNDKEIKRRLSKLPRTPDEKLR